MIKLFNIVLKGNPEGAKYNEFLWVHFRVLSYQIGRVLTGLLPLLILTIHTLLKLELVLELTWSVNILNMSIVNCTFIIIPNK